MAIEIIYEKKYPRTDSSEDIKEIEREAENKPEKSVSSFDKVYEKIMADTVYIPIPGRIKGSEAFIKTAIEVSQGYRLDTRIERRRSHISVIYSFNCGSGMRDIRRVFAMTDEFSFFRDIYGFDFTISMDYYTHAVIRRGRVVAPDVDLAELKYMLLQ